MIPRRTESAFGYKPAGREDDKVRHCSAYNRTRCRKDGKDTRVGVIVADTSDGIEPAKIILVRVVVAVPRYYIERTVILCRIEKSPAKFDRDDPIRLIVLISRDRCLKIACIRQTIGSDRAELGKLKVALEELKNVSSTWPFGQVYAISNSSRDHRDLPGTNEKPAKFSLNVKCALLGDN